MKISTDNKNIKTATISRMDEIDGKIMTINEIIKEDLDEIKDDNCDMKRNINIINKTIDDINENIKELYKLELEVIQDHEKLINDIIICGIITILQTLIIIYLILTH